MARKTKAPVTVVTETELLTPEVLVDSVQSDAGVTATEVKLDTTTEQKEVTGESLVSVVEVKELIETPIQEELGFAARYKAPEYVITKQGGLTFFDLPTK